MVTCPVENYLVKQMKIEPGLNRSKFAMLVGVSRAYLSMHKKYPEMRWKTEVAKRVEIATKGEVKAVDLVMR